MAAAHTHTRDRLEPTVFARSLARVPDHHEQAPHIALLLPRAAAGIAVGVSIVGGDLSVCACIFCVGYV